MVMTMSQAKNVVCSKPATFRPFYCSRKFSLVLLLSQWCFFIHSFYTTDASLTLAVLSLTLVVLSLILAVLSLTLSALSLPSLFTW